MNPNNGFSTNYHEGNMIYSYDPTKYKIEFNIPEYLHPIIWKKTLYILNYKNRDFSNPEKFSICCTECKKDSKEGIWAENFYVCKSCCCMIMSYFEHCFF